MRQPVPFSAQPRNNPHQTLYRVSIKSFPDYKHLLQEKYVEYKHIFLPLLKFFFFVIAHPDVL